MLDVILSRQSVRKYRDSEKVKKEDVSDLLKAAMQAPSAGNEQPWQFIVIDDDTVIRDLSKSQPYAPFLKDVHTAILVCGDTSLEQFKGFWIIDCSAATQNILLAAHAKGLGAIWLGIHPIDERVEATRQICKLPDTLIPVSLIPLGYSDEKRDVALRYDEKRVHRNIFGNRYAD